MDTKDGSQQQIERRLIEVGSADGVEAGTLEVTIAGRLEPGGLAICAAHPSDDFVATAGLIHDTTGLPAVCVNMRGVGGSSALIAPPALAVAAMADDVEAVRRRLGLAPWVFWGMSGGGWIGEQHAHRHADGVAALILESACACFRVRLADPACILSPFHPAWQQLAGAGLIAAGSHAEVGDPADTEWTDLPGVGAIFRRRGGPALLVSPIPVDARLRAVMPALWCFDARGWLGRLRAPTLVLAGGADPVVPVSHARALHQAIPGAQLVVLDGASHVPTGQRHAEARAAVEHFLRTR